MSGTPNKSESARGRVGSVLKDKWRLDALLGVGGTAAVYAASHRNGKRAAIKILHHELSSNADLVGRFLREGYVANKLEHPGAVSVLDDDRTEDGAVFLVMELLDGYSLDYHTRPNAERLTVRQVVTIGDEVLDVLANAHSRGVVHRDIKPANLFLSSSGKVKVLDFGIARLREGNNDVSATQTGTAIGTPAFMPPEQARGRWAQVDARTDLWAVGATLFALLTGQRPRRAETVNEELLLAMTAPVARIQSVAPDVAPAVAAVIDRALAFEMDARWPDARTMQVALRAAGTQLGMTGPVSAFSSTIGAFNNVQQDTAPALYGNPNAPSSLASTTQAPAPVPMAATAAMQSPSTSPPTTQSSMAHTGFGAPPATALADAMTVPMPMTPNHDGATGDFADPRLTTSRPILTDPGAPSPRPKSGAGSKIAVGAFVLFAIVVGVGGIGFYKLRASHVAVDAMPNNAKAPDPPSVIGTSSSVASTPASAPLTTNPHEASAATPGATSSVAPSVTFKPAAPAKTASRGAAPPSPPPASPPAPPPATPATPKPAAASSGNPWNERF
jgi:serine/threonine-protein kinase